jgi:hypothetical protein
VPPQPDDRRPVCGEERGEEAAREAAGDRRAAPANGEPGDAPLENGVVMAWTAAAVPESMLRRV